MEEFYQDPKEAPEFFVYEIWLGPPPYKYDYRTGAEKELYVIRHRCLDSMDAGYVLSMLVKRKGEVRNGSMLVGAELSTEIWGGRCAQHVP